MFDFVAVKDGSFPKTVTSFISKCEEHIFNCEVIWQVFYVLGKLHHHCHRWSNLGPVHACLSKKLQISHLAPKSLLIRIKWLIHRNLFCRTVCGFLLTLDSGNSQFHQSCCFLLSLSSFIECYCYCSPNSSCWRQFLHLKLKLGIGDSWMELEQDRAFVVFHLCRLLFQDQIKKKKNKEQSIPLL